MDSLQPLVSLVKRYRQRSVLNFVIVFILSLGQVMVGGLLVQGFIIKSILANKSSDASDV